MSRSTSRTAGLDLDAELRRIDPTSGGTDRSTSAAADRVLAAVLMTPRESTTTTAPAPATSVGAPTGTPPRRALGGRRRWVVTGLAAAAVAGGVAVVPTLTGTEPSAFATWTPEPTALSPQESAALQAECLSYADTTEADGSPSVPVGGLSEERGLYTYTLVATAQGISTCFALDPAAPGYDHPDAAQTAASWVPASDLPVPPVDGTSVLWGGNVRSPSGEWTWALGRAGADVTGVVLVDGAGRRVEATVEDGYFAAWWPGDGHRDLTVETTLADGTTATREVTQGDR